MPRILYVTGFPPFTRAKDLAHEFEKYAFPKPYESRCRIRTIAYLLLLCFFAFTHSASADTES
jgi:hypothetical protein